MVGWLYEHEMLNCEYLAFAKNKREWTSTNENVSWWKKTCQYVPSLVNVYRPLKFKSNLFFPTATIASSSAFLHISFNMRCKDIGFQSMTLTFISEMREFVKLHGAFQLYLRVEFRCTVYTIAYQYRMPSLHSNSHLQTEIQFSLIILCLWGGGEHIWERCRCELATPSHSVHVHAKTETQIPNSVCRLTFE